MKPPDCHHSNPHIQFIVFHPRISFTARQSRVRMHLLFARYDASWLVLGFTSAVNYGLKLACDALETLKRDGFSEAAGDRLSCALLYLAWLVKPESFASTYGIMVGYDSRDEAQISGFDEMRWTLALAEAKRRGLTS